MSTQSPATIFISAGELSGDLHAAHLVTELKKWLPDTHFFGMGHTKMREAGVELIADLTSASTVGFLEPILHFPRIFFTYRKLLSEIKKRKPALVIVVDFQGFHVPFIQKVKKLGIPVVYYIAPQEWIWGSDQGGRKISQSTDQILSVFPQEAEFYRRLGGNVIYVGNPSYDEAVCTTTRAEFFSQLGLSEQDEIVSVFPGSRAQELTQVYPALLLAAKKLSENLVRLKIVVSISSKIYEEKIRAIAKNLGASNVLFYTGKSHELIAHTKLSLVSSGTISLEHAYLGTPCIVGYRFSILSYLLIRLLYTEKFKSIRYISLPSLLLREPIIPELIQSELTVENLVITATRLLTNDSTYQKMKSDFARVREFLGEKGAAGRAAKAIADLL